MKKVLIGIGSVLIMAFVVVSVANANKSTQDDKKAKTEVKKDCSKCPNAATCDPSTAHKTMTCDPEKCKAAGCDPEKCKATGCDPANCKAKCEKAGTEMKSCDPAACPGHAKKPAVK
jgi:hypothetical protein